MAVLEWLVAQWPLAVGGAIAAMALAGWVERIKRVQELELKVKQLEREEAEQEKRLVLPTRDEIERYGSSSKALRQILRRPDLFLGIIAILGPLAAGIYQLYAVSESERRIDSQLARVQARLDATDREIADVTKQLHVATDEALNELSGRGASRNVGMGPVYRELVSRRDRIAKQLQELQRQKDTLALRRSALEQERHEVRPVLLRRGGER